MRAGTSVAYWTFNYQPRWEASSKEMQFLSQALKGSYETHVISQNLQGERFRLLGPVKCLPLPFSLALLPIVPLWANRYQINHLWSSPGERLLIRRLGGPATLLTATKTPRSLGDVERNIEYLKTLRYVVVESEADRDMLRQCGLVGDSLRLIYPGATIRPYVRSPEPFTLLFATAPLERRDLLSRGVRLLLAAAARLPEVRFLLIWRNSDYSVLRGLITESGARNVEVRNGYIADMGALYQASHATMLPGLERRSLKPVPRSALESLAHGKPVLVSEALPLSRLIRQHGCGVVFEPTVDSLVDAVRHLAAEFDRYQANCHSTISATFSRDVYVERYRRLYESML